MTHHDAARKWMVKTALAYLGTPYRWGGDDPSGFDCSGLVIECLKSIGLMNAGDLSADQLYQSWSKYAVTNPNSGCLVFWLKSSGTAFHVGVCLDEWHQISAGGGDRTITTEEDAWKKNSYVRIRPIPLSRSRCRFCDPLKALKE